MNESVKMGESSFIGSEYSLHQPIKWKAKWEVKKYHGQPENVDFATPYEVVQREGNLLMNGGASCIWQTLIGNGSAGAGGDLTYFSNANAAIGCGTSQAAAAATQTDLQAAAGTANQIRKAMDATYPTHTDGVNAAAGTVTFRSTFGTADANFSWYEWGVFNSATAATGRMLNRKQESLGSKTSASTWTFSVSLSLA
jgi:hypothetical protein